MNQARLVAHTCTNQRRQRSIARQWCCLGKGSRQFHQVGRLIILIFFSEFRFTEYIMASSTRWRSNCNPRSLKTKSPRATSVFSAHLHKLSLLIHKITKRTIPVRMTKVSVQRITMNLKMTLKTLKTERKTEISLRMVGTPVVSPSNSKSSLDEHERTHGIRWKRLWFRRWRGAYLNARWSQYPKRRRWRINTKMEIEPLRQRSTFFIT